MDQAIGPPPVRQRRLHGIAHPAAAPSARCRAAGSRQRRRGSACSTGYPARTARCPTASRYWPAPCRWSPAAAATRPGLRAVRMAVPCRLSPIARLHLGQPPLHQLQHRRLADGLRLGHMRQAARQPFLPVGQRLHRAGPASPVRAAAARPSAPPARRRAGSAAGSAAPAPPPPAASQSGSTPWGRASIDHRAPEQPFDIGQLQFHIGRPPVVALAGMRRRLHLAQQRVHLLGPHLRGPSGPSRGRPCGDSTASIRACTSPLSPRSASSSSTSREQRRCASTCAQNAPASRARRPPLPPKGSMTSPSRAQVRRKLQQARGVAGDSSTISGISSACAAMPALGHLPLQPFVDQPLMRGVLDRRSPCRSAVWAMM